MAKRRARRQSDMRDGVSLVFSFFLALALVAEAALLVVYAGFFTESGFLSVLDDDYYAYALSYLNDQARYYTMPTGFDPDILDGAFTEGELRFHTRQHVESAFRGTDYEPDTSDIEARLTDNVEAFFKENGIQASAETASATEAYVTDILEIYLDVAKLPGLESVARVRMQVSRYVLLGLVAGAIMLVVLVILIVRLHHFLHRSIRYVAYAMGGAALMCFVVPCILYQSKFYLGLNLTPQYFYHFGVSLVARTLLLCMGAAALYFALTITLAFWAGSLRKKSLRHRDGHES